MAKQLKDLHILIVDDNAQAVSLITMVLEGIGVTRIATASEGAEAIKQIEAAAGSVDVVISDKNMPGMSGVELLKSIRATNPDLPFIMISGDVSPEFRAEAEALGISGMIGKPFPPQEVEDKIRALAETL